jgi:hypothetical protein
MNAENLWKIVEALNTAIEHQRTLMQFALPQTPVKPQTKGKPQPVVAPTYELNGEGNDLEYGWKMKKSGAANQVMIDLPPSVAQRLGERPLNAQKVWGAIKTIADTYGSKQEKEPDLPEKLTAQTRAIEETKRLQAEAQEHVAKTESELAFL